MLILAALSLKDHHDIAGHTVKRRYLMIRSHPLRTSRVDTDGFAKGALMARRRFTGVYGRDICTKER